jgi:glycosyltransferase involved in cell wall biosynthesis
VTIYSYVAGRFEDGFRTGVPRFDYSLRRIFPGLKSVIEPEFSPGATVITDNHLSLNVPAELRTIVVHHGCAAAHFARDPQWHTEHTVTIALLQGDMFQRPNRTFVAPSSWVVQMFREWHEPADYAPVIITHWVKAIRRIESQRPRPIIIGDWRDNNKGLNAWQNLARQCPQYEFRPLHFSTEAEKEQFYGEADLYLCLSLSEGGSYSMCDAEAAELPIVSTNVGNYREFDDCEMIAWDKRDQVEYVAGAIERKLRTGRRKDSFYKAYTYECWHEKWQALTR